MLEHVNDFRIALQEVHRILRHKGAFICSFPMAPHIDLVDEDAEVRTDRERFERFGQFDHKRIFGLNAGRLMENAGFNVEIISGHDYPDEILPVVGPADYDMNTLFCCVNEKKSFS